MEKYLKTVIAVIFCFMACFFNAVVVKAATPKEVKARWYDTRYYPLYQGNEEWQKHNMADTLDILNPPLDLLLSMSTEELANLMQEHPLMGQITTYFDAEGEQDYATFYSFLEANSDIFYELLRREDGITGLLQAYRTSGCNEAQVVEGEYVPEDEKKWFAELFGCQFIRYYGDCFTDAEYTLASQIIEEKKEIYSLLNETQLYYLDLPDPEPPVEANENNIRTKYLLPEEIQEKEERLAAALLEMKKKETDSQETMSDAEDSTTGNAEENVDMTAEPKEEKKHLGLWIASVCIIGAVCIAGVLIWIRRRK